MTQRETIESWKTRIFSENPCVTFPLVVSFKVMVEVQMTF